jgi:hypothetical protein
MVERPEGLGSRDEKKGHRLLACRKIIHGFQLLRVGNL